MTRYTRAKGSKASNERLPNDATPWHIMKQQLEECKNHKAVEKKKSAKELLNDTFYSNTLGNINYDWADFDDHKSKSNIKTHKNLETKRYATSTQNSGLSNTVHTAVSKDCNNTEKLQEVQCIEIEKEKAEKKNKSNKKEQYMNESYPQFKQKQLNTRDTDFMSKRQKRNQKRKLELSGPNGSEKRRELKEKKEYKRRKPDVGITKMVINGVEIEIVKYDGFPIKKEDAERLTELKQQMIMKGIPKTEIDIAIKLERRKAEKALARVKKVVCFQCRKSGHNLSDCPELGSEEACTGICFKCGSTEHTHYECKVNKNSTYRYATCFICREQGHIAAQCPDNPRGIYPQGGSCKVCGAVTHLKKDCPDLVKEKEDNIVTVEKMADDCGVESLQKDLKDRDNSNMKSKNKIIKF